jgi:hypothetical protein
MSPGPARPGPAWNPPPRPRARPPQAPRPGAAARPHGLRPARPAGGAGRAGFPSADHGGGAGGGVCGARRARCFARGPGSGGRPRGRAMKLCRGRRRGFATAHSEAQHVVEFCGQIQPISTRGFAAALGRAGCNGPPKTGGPKQEAKANSRYHLCGLLRSDSIRADSIRAAARRSAARPPLHGPCRCARPTRRGKGGGGACREGAGGGDGPPTTGCWAVP